MKSIILFVVASIGLANCGYISDESNHVGGLRIIAQGSANQAHSAVANQHAAAQKASFIAKNALAQQAAQAAATAQAALAGKHVLLQTLERQRNEAHNSLEGELAQLQSTEQSSKAAINGAQQAAKMVQVLLDVLRNAQELAHQAEASAGHSAQELASQTAMAGQAKANLQEVEHKLEATRADFLATKEAAQKAAQFAQKAQNNAAAVAVHSIPSGNGGSGLGRGQSNGDARYFH